MRPILIVKTGSTLPELAARKGDFEDWGLRGMGVPQEHVVTVDVEAGGALPAPQTLAGAVVTGSHAMVTDICSFGPQHQLRESHSWPNL